IDFGVYYDPSEPLDIPALRALAADLNETPDPVVTEPGGWGRWVNGGAWLTISGQRVDFIYRDMVRVAEVIADCLKGNAEFHYYQHPPYGFRSHTYLAEVRLARVLHDPDRAVARLN